MYAPRLSRTLYDKFIEAKISKIRFNIEGGDDQGYINVYINMDENNIPMANKEKIHNLEQEMEEYIWEKTSFSGAGVGIPYGYKYLYDLNENTITETEWFMEEKVLDPVEFEEVCNDKD